MQHRLKEITQEMKIKAAEAIANSVIESPRPNYIIPDSLDKDVAIRISKELGKLKKKSSQWVIASFFFKAKIIDECRMKQNIAFYTPDSILCYLILWYYNIEPVSNSAGNSFEF